MRVIDKGDYNLRIMRVVAWDRRRMRMRARVGVQVSSGSSGHEILITRLDSILVGARLLWLAILPLRRN